MRFDYGRALDILNETERRHRASSPLLAEYGSLYLTVEETERAKKYFDQALQLDSTNLDALIGRAGADILSRDYAAGEVRIRDLLKHAPSQSRVHVLMARIRLEEHQNSEAEAHAREALALDQNDIDGIYLLAFLKAAERTPDEVRELARRGLALNPASAGLRRLLASYVDGQKGHTQKVSPEARNHYTRARLFKQEGKLTEARLALETAISIEPTYYSVLVALGDIALRQENYELAVSLAKRAVAVDSDGSLAHLILSYAYQGIQERARIRMGAINFAERFFAGNQTKESSDLTGRIFPEYRLLTQRQKRVIDYTVRDLAQFLPVLVDKGARHHLIPFDQRVSDTKGVEDIGHRLTFDGRYYASLRGVGGRVAASGIEYIEMALNCGANIIAHEFAHQVHMSAMGQDYLKRIRRLYEQALKEGRALDFYAAANEYEYFAQGYEAFVSVEKRPGASLTARHTRRELELRDPELFRFLLQISQGSRAFLKRRGFALAA
jgi:tetratricopeptide (TPR) repeat protein